MRIRAQLYGQLRGVAGDSELTIELTDGATVKELLEKIYQQKPALRLHDKAILIGAGVEFVDRNHALKDADEISIMPPVQGG